MIDPPIPEGGAPPLEQELAKRGIETVPCDCCQWPMPYQFHNRSLICPCCGFEPECDDAAAYREAWNSKWWGAEERAPLIVQRLQKHVSDLRAALEALVDEGTKATSGPFVSHAIGNALATARALLADK